MSMKGRIAIGSLLGIHSENFTIQMKKSSGTYLIDRSMTTTYRRRIEADTEQDSKENESSGFFITERLTGHGEVAWSASGAVERLLSH